ncbi:MAG: leishmanolysin-related zinc metalloendopeptidase, partial [Pseudomonadota bacterium]
PNSTGISDRFIDTTIQADGYFLHSRGRVQWNLDGDYSDLSAPTLETIAVHEFAHALGFNPRIFLENGVVPTDPDAPDAERAKYIGENALAAYNEILGTAVDFVPLELGGGAGTAFSHWDEYEFMNHGVNNGILPECDLFESDSFDCFLALPIEERQRVSPLLDNPELMTGWLSVSSETPLQMSPVTLAVFSDIGYSLAGTAAVPVPPAGLLLLGGIAGLAGMRQRAGSSLD